MGHRGIDFELEKGWLAIQAGIDKVVSFVDACGRNHEELRKQFTFHDLERIHHAMYKLVMQQRSIELCRRYKIIFQNYIRSHILPAVREKSGELLLREVVKRWHDYKFITHWITRFFYYLEKYFVSRQKLPTMHDTSLLILQNMAYAEIKDKLIAAVLSLINKDREVNLVNPALIKEVLVIVYDLQSETINEPYQTDFEQTLFDSSCSYYLIKRDRWLQNLSYAEYMLQVVGWLNDEKSRATQYLPPSTVSKLLELLNLKLAIPDSQM